MTPVPIAHRRRLGAALALLPPQQLVHVLLEQRLD